MSKRHFIAVAAALRAHNAPLTLINSLADTFAALNKHFDRARFVAAATEG